MRRQATVVFGVIGVALTLGAGIAEAAPGPNPCKPASQICGTDGRDTLAGTRGADYIRGMGGGDDLKGGAGNDRLYGDSQDNASLDGDDVLVGGAGDDWLDGNGGTDQLFGGDGNDLIDSRDFVNFHHPAGLDTVAAGAGHDTVEARDGFKDEIDCGRGRDVVFYDRDLDVLTNCEDARLA